jgi:hypothetical protein
MNKIKTLAEVSGLFADNQTIMFAAFSPWHSGIACDLLVEKASKISR